MKNVLIVDPPPMLREFLTEKLTSEKIGVEIADGQRDALPKFLSILPDLLIVNVEHSSYDIIDFLEKKQSDPNGKKIPVIMTGPKIDHAEVADLVQYGVIKYFTKPIKFDLFFEAIGRVLRVPFSIDPTPSVLDIHLNHDIIFIEIANGLNHEKITLLKYRLSEIIENNNLHLPKVILMMSSLSLSYVDGLNLELLLTNLTADKRILKRKIKILSLDPFVSDFIDGHPNFEGIEVVKSLSNVVDSFGPELKPQQGLMMDFISDNILSATEEKSHSEMAMRFFSDTGLENSNDELTTGQLKIAIIDSDQQVIKYLKDIAETLGEVTVFTSCKEFIQHINEATYTMAITGMFMPEVTGLDLLKYLVTNHIDLPVIIYSSIIQKEVIMQSLKMGASSYLIKPQSQEVITQKILEIANANRE
ncbi:MAG: response regulator [Treponema sp.]|nr:response regulator [Treponema sp.]